MIGYQNAAILGRSRKDTRKVVPETLMSPADPLSGYRILPQNRDYINLAECPFHAPRSITPFPSLEIALDHRIAPAGPQFVAIFQFGSPLVPIRVAAAAGCPQARSDSCDAPRQKEQRCSLSSHISLSRQTIETNGQAPRLRRWIVSLAAGALFRLFVGRP